MRSLDFERKMIVFCRSHVSKIMKTSYSVAQFKAWKSFLAPFGIRNKIFMLLGSGHFSFALVNAEDAEKSSGVTALLLRGAERRMRLGKLGLR